ncbi:MAG: hypothetical protein IKP28_04060 [Clostridia bacterium]|nr:hypothetical protein [Clostridia bacterium]
MKTVLKCVVIYIVLTIFFVASLVGASCIPSEAIHKNTTETAITMLLEGNRKIVNIPYRSFEMQFDNYSDALMINTIYSIDSNHPLESAFLNRKNYIEGKTKTVEADKVGELSSSSKYQYHNEVGELYDLVNGEAEESFEYARYWHGYIIILRILLTFLNLDAIRIFLFIVLFALAVVLFYLVQKKTNPLIGIIFEIGLFSVEYFYLAYTLQGVFVFLIAVIASIVLLIRSETMKNKVPVFFVAGMLANFFDLLTVPMVTFAVPLIAVLLINEKDNNTWKEIILETIKLGIAWLVGYGATWITKWILVDIIFNRNLLSVALQQITYRSNARSYTILEAIESNLQYETIIIPATLLVTSIATIICTRSNLLKNKHYKLTEILPYIIVAMAPYIWYALIRNHSVEHSFFTYRNQIITVLGLNIFIHRFLAELTKKEEPREINNIEKFKDQISVNNETDKNK